MAAAVETNRFHAAEYLTSANDQAALLAGALESGDAQIVAHALGVIARICGMTDVARAAEVTRESLYRALSDTGNPELRTVLAVVRALGLKLTAAPA